MSAVHDPIVVVDRHATQARCLGCGWVGPDRTGDPHAAGLVTDDVDWHLEGHLEVVGQ